MPVRHRNAIACAALLLAVLSGARAASAALPPLIPRAALFSNPERTAARISPDGTKLLYLAPSGGVLSVWVRTLGRSDDHVVAHDPARPIRVAAWRPDSRGVLYLQDQGGNENFHLFSVPFAGGAAAELTPYPNVRVAIDAIDPAHPDTVLIDMNKRDPKLFDVYRLSLATGEATLDTQNPGNVAGWQADSHLVVRAALATKPDASSDIIVRDSAATPWRTLLTFSPEDGQPSIAGFTPDGRGLYVISSQGSNAARLVRIDTQSGAQAVVAADPTFDVDSALFSERTHELVAAAIQRARLDWTVLNPAYAADFAALHTAAPGDFTITASDAADRWWDVSYDNDNASASYWLYDRTIHRAQKLFDARPALARYRLARMQPIAFTARDGTRIAGYLTLPVGVPPRRLPTVLFVHGGPWARDTWGYSGYVQWLANRGYAVLQVNFRGSTGYGRTFLNAGDREWAGTMRTDLLDAEAWAVRRGYADPGRVAIMGGSYGGYATLTALAFSPGAFACGVDIVGPSNLNTLLASIPPYWETGRAQFRRRMGDTAEFLASQSPLFKANQIERPLLVGQGANDPRVNIRESDQIVAALRKKGLPVTYIVFPDEGHGFARPENTRRFNAATEAFLGKCLGGRVEPAKPDESVAQFLH